MKRSIFALTAATMLALTAAPALADAPYGNNDKMYNLNSSDGVKKLFSDNQSGGHGQ